MARPYKCKNCGSTRSAWKGYRKLAGGSRVRLKKCKDCGTKFTTRVVLDD